VSDTPILGEEDIRRLLEDPSPESRADTVRKVGAYMSTGDAGDGERALADDIYSLLVDDVETTVRRALSETLAASDSIPPGLARKLAHDIDEIAIPFIETARTLSDEDLLDIVDTGQSQRQQAVARRSTVTARIADALAEKGDEAAVSTLIGNEGAELRDATLNKALDRFPESERVKAPMVKRRKLPAHVAERLVNMVSDSLREHLATHHELPDSLATDLIFESRERATVSLLQAGGGVGDPEVLIAQLHENGRLTPSLVMRALCTGDVVFFEAAMARLAGIPPINAYQLIHDAGGEGLRRLFEKSGMPDSLLELARIALDIAGEMDFVGSDDRATFRTLMIERVLTRFDSMDDRDIDYLIGKLSRRDTAS